MQANNYIKVLGIDPGTDKSAIVGIDNTGRIMPMGIRENREIQIALKENMQPTVIYCEMIASYGMAVGRETFETCVWIGRFMESVDYTIPFIRVFRKDIKLELCGTAKAKDANIRQALIDIYGKSGTMKNPGATFGISSHQWAALAVAHYGFAKETGKLTRV